MTEKTFRNTQQFRDELKALLDNPTMKMALDIVAERAKPRKIVEAKPGVPLDTLVSHKYHQSWGIQSALDRLILLTEPYPVEGDQSEDENEFGEFGHALPDQVKDALRKLRQSEVQP